MDEIKFKIALKENDLYYFMMHHYYSKNHCQLNTFFCKIHRHNLDFHHVTDTDYFHRVADKFLICQL